MHRDKRTYTAPHLRKIEGAAIFEQGWNRQQLLQVRELIAKALQLAEPDESRAEVTAKLRATLRKIDAELATPTADPASASRPS